MTTMGTLAGEDHLEVLRGVVVVVVDREADVIREALGRVRLPASRERVGRRRAHALTGA